MPSLNLKQQNLKLLLKQYQKQVDDIISEKFPCLFYQSKLQDPAQYVLDGGGKRFRPIITLIVAGLLNKGCDVSYAAMSIELFHTASLIVDDLPCMDNDDFRRERASLHKKYGEDVSLLTSYALIGAGYECLIKNKNELKQKLADIDQRALIAIESLAKCNGLNGAPHGQFLDIYPPEINQESLDHIFYQKTVIFFETAFLFGWLYGGGDLKLLSELKKAAYHFGMAFQIYDDFCDKKQDLSKDKKINYPLALGDDFSKTSLRLHILKCSEKLKLLNLHGKQFQELLKFMGSVLD